MMAMASPHLGQANRGCSLSQAPVLKNSFPHSGLGQRSWIFAAETSSIAAGGLLYTVGVVFFAWERLRYGHTVWHLFVLGGSACHFLAVLRKPLQPTNPRIT